MVTDLLLEAANLMLLGMAAVFIFLLALVLLLKLMSKVLQRYFPVKQPEKSNKIEQGETNHLSPAVVAAITAAVHQYRNQ